MCHRAVRGHIGHKDFFAGTQYLGALAHKRYAAEYDDIGGTLLCDLGEIEGIADVVSDLLNVVRSIVMGKNNCVLCLFYLFDLIFPIYLSLRAASVS